jgi:cytochrome b561
MIREFAYMPILGVPFIVYWGFTAITLMAATISIPILNQRKLAKIPMKYHILLAKITVAVAIIHGFLAASAYFGY